MIPAGWHKLLRLVEAAAAWLEVDIRPKQVPVPEHLARLGVDNTPLPK